MKKSSNARDGGRAWRGALSALVAGLAIGGCNDQIHAVDIQAGGATGRGPVRSLTLTGYNYTARYIDQFSVDGVEGGNIFVSSPHGGGGGSVCCVNYRVGTKGWKATIRWQSGACTYNNRTDTSGQRLYEIFHYFKEQEVEVAGQITPDPHYFEVHFFPDGHVEAAITDQSSDPRLSLSEERQDKTLYGKCPNDKRPNT